MDRKIKSGMKYAAVFIMGIIVGAILLETLEIQVRKTYKELIVTQLKVEQESLASKANRENRLIESAFHRWATINAESEDGFRILRPVTDGISDKSYLLPFQLVVLKMISSPENVQKGRKVIEGINRGKLAIALETLGQSEAAQQQWQIAHQLMRRPTMEATRKSVSSLLEQEKSDLHLQADEAVLRMRNK
jgi:hypothetical protein